MFILSVFYKMSDNSVYMYNVFNVIKRVHIRIRIHDVINASYQMFYKSPSLSLAWFSSVMPNWLRNNLQFNKSDVRGINFLQQKRYTILWRSLQLYLMW